MGLATSQIAAANWDDSKPGLPLFRQLVKDRVAEAMKARAEIQAAPDETTRAIQEARHHALEGRVAPIRTMGDAVIAAFFAADKAKEREKRRTEIESLLTGSLEAQAQKLDAVVASLRSAKNPIPPFHWQIEFPEVFVHENGGFDAIVGNPPFLGGSKISGNFGHSYLAWLLNIHEDSHGNNPAWIKALAEVRRLAPPEGDCYHHVQAIIVSSDQYPEKALGNREFFLNKPHSVGGERKENIP